MLGGTTGWLVLAVHLGGVEFIYYYFLSFIILIPFSVVLEFPVSNKAPVTVFITLGIVIEYTQIK